MFLFTFHFLQLNQLIVGVSLFTSVANHLAAVKLLKLFLPLLPSAVWNRWEPPLCTVHLQFSSVSAIQLIRIPAPHHIQPDLQQLPFTSPPPPPRRSWHHCPLKIMVIPWWGIIVKDTAHISSNLVCTMSNWLIWSLFKLLFKLSLSFQFFWTCLANRQ